MTLPSVDVHDIAFIGFLIYLLLPLGTAVILSGQDRRGRLMQWCWGSGLLSLLPLIASIGAHQIPRALLSVGFGLGFLGMLLRINALRGHLEARRQRGRLVMLCVILTLCSEAIGPLGLELQLAYVAAVQALGGFWITRLAWQLGIRLPSRSARAMALAYGVGTLVLLWRGLMILVEHSQGGRVDALAQGGHSLVLALLVLMTGIFSNIAYIGITLEGVRARERARELEAAQAAVAQRQSEAQSGQLRELLRERDDMLHLLAHEVRQPLNNASAALQSARSAAVRTLGDDTDAAPLLGRLDRAGSVIQQITSILDNTLTASSLLSTDSRLAPVEADLPSLIELCLADLAPSQRARVQVEHDAGLRTASFDPGLLRLALRNLLVNALNHTPAHTPIVLRVSEQDEPLAVLLEVIDQGPGFAPALRERAFERGVRGPRSTGLGLGLYIVRRVAELHRGRIEILPRDVPGDTGTRMRLTLPQGLMD